VTTSPHKTAFQLFLFITLLASVSCATQPRPTQSADFLRLSDGTSLTALQVEGVPLALSHGTGVAFGAEQMRQYKELKLATQTQADHSVQWALMDLDSQRVIGHSVGWERPIFGASLSKLFVAGALLDHQRGHLSPAQLQLLAEMLVISSNSAWVELQLELGDGNPDLGRSRNSEFTQRLGLRRTRGYQGNWGKVHGNELSAAELADYLSAVYHRRFAGADTLWKTLHTVRSGVDRGRKYLPSEQLVGEKTGTYDGPTVNAETGQELRGDGTPYVVQVRHQVLLFPRNGHEYALVILADTGSDESAALLAGGLYAELRSN
jgi:hypothetical protein